MACHVRSWFLVPASDLSDLVPILQDLRIDVEGVLIRLSGSRVCVLEVDLSVNDNGLPTMPS